MTQDAMQNAAGATAAAAKAASSGHDRTSKSLKEDLCVHVVL